MVSYNHDAMKSQVTKMKELAFYTIVLCGVLPGLCVVFAFCRNSLSSWRAGERVNSLVILAISAVIALMLFAFCGFAATQFQLVN